MISDAELAAEIEAEEAKPKKAKKAPKEEVIVVDGDPARKVWVRCVTDLEPWATNADGQLVPLKHWQAYEISMVEAALLESRRMAVILETPTKG